MRNAKTEKFEFTAANNGSSGIAEVKLEGGEEIELSIGLDRESIRACNRVTGVEYELDFSQPSLSIDWCRSLSREEAARAAVENWLEVEREMRAA